MEPESSETEYSARLVGESLSKTLLMPSFYVHRQQTGSAVSAQGSVSRAACMAVKLRSAGMVMTAVSVNPVRCGTHSYNARFIRKRLLTTAIQRLFGQDGR
ncbi:hypothetical protein RHECNPAF_2530027 [Rhizobium etli CNPAF512]|nr:hypothetical protein RHECNPAF_2530027 [Rhizobium etli CNPAF512]